MPSGSGWDVLREVRRLAPRVPIVAITGQLVLDGRGELVHHGFSAALLKPVDPTHLVAVVADVLRTEPHT